MIRPWRQVTMVFAKAPVLGAVKTRLIPRLGKEYAALLHDAMVRHCVAQTAQYTNHEIQLWCSPDTTHPLFEHLQKKYQLTVYRQIGRDLGHRMYNAFVQALTQYDAAVVIGTDCPLVSPGLLDQAFQTLHTEDAVIAPAEDGGYVLLGLKKVFMELFTDIAWGKDQVYEQTRIKLQHLQLSSRPLEMQWDIDRPEDLQRLFEIAPVTELHPDLQTVIERISL